MAAWRGWNMTACSVLDLGGHRPPCCGHDNAMRQTVFALLADATVSDHENPGEATLFVLTGRVELTTDQSREQGGEGDLLVVADAIHGLRAVEDAVVLLAAVPR